ncbi:MAG TPA: hypothetical protein VGR37_04930, partial [Longimicrobiaceae bacterium]|nr:hypothetical protein [Longimicrobiaceae bacterium]
PEPPPAESPAVAATGRVTGSLADGRITRPSDTPDAEGWTTEMMLADGRLGYDDEREGRTWNLAVEGRDFVVQSNRSTARVSPRPRGHVILRETGPVTRSVEIRADAAGRETRSFHVDGTRRAYDAEAAAWTAGFLQRLHGHLNERRSGGASTGGAATGSGGDGTQVWNATHETVHEHHGRPASDLELVARRVQIRGRQVVGILPGGTLTVRETLHPDYPDPDPLKPGPGGVTTRTLHASRTGAGGVSWTYRVNGVERPFEGEARTWFGRILREYTMRG